MKKRNKIIIVLLGLVGLLGHSFVNYWGTLGAAYLHALISSATSKKVGLIPVSDVSPPDSMHPMGCWETSFQNTTGWDFSYYQSNKDGFYTLRPGTYPSYLAPPIWLNSEIPTAFDALTFRATIIGNNNLPTLIISLGKDPAKRIFEFRISDGKAKDKNTQLVTFSRLVLVPGSSGYEFKPFIAKSLRDPIEKGTPIVISVTAEYKGRGRMDYHFVVSYKSAYPEIGQLDDRFEYYVELPDVEPISAGGQFEKTDFGFAVYKGSSVKPMKFEICPFHP